MAAITRWNFASLPTGRRAGSFAGRGGIIPPYAFSATLTGLDSVSLTWSNGQAYDSVEVYQSTDGGGSYSHYDTLTGSATSTSYSGLAGSTAYCWYVKGKVSGVESAAASADCETTAGSCCSDLVIGDTYGTLALSLPGITGTPFSLVQQAPSPPCYCWWYLAVTRQAFGTGHYFDELTVFQYPQEGGACGYTYLMGVVSDSVTGDIWTYDAHDIIAAGYTNELIFSNTTGQIALPSGAPDYCEVADAATVRSCSTADQLTAPPYDLTATPNPSGHRIDIEWTNGDATCETILDFGTDKPAYWTTLRRAFDDTQPFQPNGTGYSVTVAAGVTSYTMTDFPGPTALSGFEDYYIYVRARHAKTS